MAKAGRDDEAADLAFYLDFAQADLPTYRDGDVLNAWEAIEAWGSEAGLASLAVNSHGHPEVREARAWLTAAQARLRSLFADVGAGERVSVPFDGTVTFEAGDVAYVPRRGSAKERFTDAVVLHVVDLLTRGDLARLHKCPECGRLFWASGRRHQKFDRPECRLRDWFKRKETRRSRGRR